MASRQFRGGFALVVALALMGLVLALIFSLSILLRINITAAANETKVALARQHALLGVRAAISQLQEAVGSDQRVTAEASLFSSDVAVAEPRWVGVWHSNPVEDDGDPSTLEQPLSSTNQRDWDSFDGADKLDGALSWLVSGSDPDPQTGAPGSVQGIVIHRVGTGVEVRSEFEDVNENGRYAYWVRDESQKVRINLSDPFRGSPDALIAEQSARVAQRFAPEAVLSAAGGGQLPSEAEWGALQELEQLSLFGIETDGLDDDFTTRAASVLAYIREGRLKRDLTAIARLPATGLDNGVTVDAGSLPGELSNNRFLYTIGDLSDEIVGSSLPDNPNVGPLNNPVYGPRIETLWDFMNHRRLLGSGDSLDVHEPATNDWLAFVDGQVSQGDATYKMEVQDALLGQRPFVEGDEREVDFFPPYEAMALGDQLDFGSGTQLYRELVPEKHTLITSAVAPIMTELIFYVRVSVTDTEISLQAHPFLEYTNPYDVPIRLEHELWQATFSLRLAFDFRLVDTDGTLVDRVWSQENEGGADPLLQIKGRSLGTMLEALGGTSAGANAAIGLRVPSGVEFEPGETKGFVASGTAGNSVTLQEGNNWRGVSLQVPVREYTFSGNDVDYGNAWPEFNPAAQPDRGSSLDDYDLLEVRVNALPMNRQGAQRLINDWNTHGGSQDNSSGPFVVRLGYQAARIPFSRERIGLFSAIGADTDVGDAFAVELPFVQAGGSWQNTAPQDAGVIQLRALSAEDFDSGTFAVGGMNEGASTFLARSNPRAPVLNDPHGFGGSRAFEATGWMTGFYDDPFNFALQESAWGETNIETDPTILFHVPRREPLSLGLLRHWNAGYTTGEPAYLLGSSQRPGGNLERDETVAWHINNDDYVLDSGNLSDFDFLGQPLAADEVTKGRTDLVLDSAFYLNRALWDSWFFSTLPSTGSPLTEPWPNSRLTVLEPAGSDTLSALRDYERAAGELLLRGAFNVNSTSERAWAAVLASRLGLGPDGGSAGANELFYPRMPGMAPGNELWEETPAIPLDAIYEPGQESDPNADTLSKRVVEEVRERGPFLSLSHFVNRLLVDDERGERGALQAALEASRVNNGNGGFTHAPGSVTQADMLGPLGPVLVARGDTFVVRSVGEVRDSLTGETTSRAWCEATVQRFPEYVDAADAPEAATRTTGLSDTNERLGRRYKIVGFRWIDPPQ